MAETTHGSAAPRKLILIDFSSLAVPIWMVSGSEPDPNWASTKIVSRVRELASGALHVVIACDSRGKNFRHEIEPTYKAQRETQPEAMYHQMELAKEILRGDGFPVVAVAGFEADDVLASFTTAALALDGVSVLIASSDKDILQLVGPRVHVKSLRDGAVLDAEGVKAKFGVAPEAMGDYLALVGDASDNVKGADGIGAKKAAMLLSQFGTLEKLMTPAAIEGLTPGLKKSLIDFSARADVVRQLIALRTDVPVPIEEAFTPRVIQEHRDMSDALRNDIAADIEDTMPTLTHSKAEEPAILPVREPEKPAGGTVETPATLQPQAALVPQVLPAPAPAAWEMQLEPRSFADAWTLAKAMFSSRLFSAYGTPEAVLSTIMAGRELGLQAMASLRSFHIIEGRPTLSAGIIQALVLKSPHCRYFRCTERTNERATFVTKRDDEPEVSLTFTIDDAKLAWSKGDEAFKKSGYGKNPADMCVARAATKLGRLVYADVVSNLYSPEEFA